MDSPPPVPSPAQPPPILHPSGYTRDEVNLAMWCHLIPILAWVLGFGLFAFLGPLLIRQQDRGRSGFVDRHAVESLNFQLSVLLYTGILVVLCVVGLFVTFGLALLILIPLFIALVVGALVLEILATVKATNGEHFDYKVSIPFIR